MKLTLIVKSIVFTILMPGVGVILIPYLIINWSDNSDLPGTSILNVIVFLFGLFCLFLLLHCIWRFAVTGRGTLAPVDPPKHLVVCGLYRYTRNPMYLAVIGALLSESILFRNIGILTYLVIGSIIFHLFVILYEEPKLRAQFGESYQKYCQSVPRWMISSKPYKGD